MSFIDLFLVAFVAYLCGMVGSIAYSVVFVRSIHDNSGGFGKMIAAAMLYGFVRWLQLPKVLFALAVSAASLQLAASVGAAFAWSAGICFGVAVLLLAVVSHGPVKK